MAKLRAMRRVVRLAAWMIVPALVVMLNAAPNGDATRLLRTPTVSATQIAFAYANNIWVENWPKDVIAGKDPQLERAVEEALKLLKAQPPNRLTTEPAPPEWGTRRSRS
jgi:hypothetical protein